MHPFSNPWKQKTTRFSEAFRGYKKGALETNGLTQKPFDILIERNLRFPELFTLILLTAHLIICLMMPQSSSYNLQFDFCHRSKKYWFLSFPPSPLALLHQLLIAGLWWHGMFSVCMSSKVLLSVIHLVCVRSFALLEHVVSH